MELADLAPIDVRGALDQHRARLLALLRGLGPEQWDASTAAPGWSVKDVAAHLVDVNLSWLARARDHDAAGLIEEAGDRAAFVDALARRNQRWVDTLWTLSPRVIVELLGWSGDRLAEFLSAVDLRAPSSVYWAGPAPLWFDLARELTERWVHGRQIMEATTQDQDATADPYLGLVLRTFVWAFPHQYDAPAADGTMVQLDIQAAGAWTLRRAGAAWTLDEGRAAQPAARLTATGDAAWRLLTGTTFDPAAVAVSGPPHLVEPLLRVRGAIV